MTYLSLLKGIVEANGSKPAIADKNGERITTYDELFTLSKRVAGKIKSLNLTVSSPVMICMDRCMEYIASYIGVLMAGNSVVPVIPQYPKSRLLYIKEDCKSEFTITEDFFADIESVSPYDYTEPDLSSPALIIYTSGSTGKPKGILHTHNSVFCGVQRDKWHYEIEEEIRFGAVAPLSFIAVFAEYFKVFAVGGCTYIIGEEIRKDASLLADYYLENKLTMGFISPQMLRVFRNKSPYLKRIITASERLSNVYYSDFEIINVYGSSELCGNGAGFLVDKKYDNTPIGKPAQDLEFFVLDENCKEVPDGEEGELCIKGVFAKEYVNLPEKTAEVFVKCDDGSILFHTNDIVKKLPDGNFVYINRKDWMVKINGQRVETGEIENLILSIDSVKGVAVKAFENKNGQNYLVAYYVSDSDSDSAIRSKIRENMPDYMMPAFFKRLSEMPKNVNGKLDRNALLPPSVEEYKAEYTAPSTELERKICSAFMQVLDCGRVGINDDFYSLGGDSIKVIMLSSVLEEEGATPQIILQNRTPKALADVLKNADATDDWCFDSTRTEYPLSTAEKAMYIEQTMNPQSVEYNLNTTLYVKGADINSVKSALKRVMANHEAFKSYYINKDGSPTRILTENIPSVEIFDISSCDDVKLKIKESNKPFDLSEIPVRVNLYPTAENEIYIQLCMHHIMIDGEGINILLKEFSDVLAGKDIVLSKYDLSYSCEHLNLNSEKHLEYFKEVFKDGVPVNEMPVKGARPKVHPVSDTMLRYEIDSFKCKRLSECARTYSATLFELLFGAVAMTVGKYCVSEDVVLGIPKNTRDGKTKNTVGMFINTLPVRVKPQRDLSVAEYIKNVSESVRSTLANSDCSFESLVNEFCKDRDLSRHPIFDVGVNMLGTSFKHSENGVDVRLMSEHQKMGRDINLFFENEDDKITLTMQYSSALFDKAVAENFADLLFTALSRIVADNSITIRKALENPKSQQELIDSFSPSADDNHGLQLLHKRFEQQVDLTPDNVAVVAADREYTYRELDNDANAVANSLIEKGFTPTDSAVVMLKRTSRFFPAILGVLKAGGAYIPTDPAYPADRIKNVLEDSESKFVITDVYSDEYSSCVTIDELLNNKNTARPDALVKPTDLAYMIYTSGSTGKPKGVMIEHKSICNFLRVNQHNLFTYTVAKEVSAFLSVTTVAFDMSMKELYSPLLTGKTLVFADEEAASDPRLLVDLFNKTGADGFNGTPSRIEQYLYVDGFEDIVKGLRLIGCGGEKYPHSLLKRLKELTKATMINSYGPTEITVSSNSTVLEEEITIGSPSLNVREYVVDKFGDELPVGVVGELYIGGMGVARGYKNLDKMTADRFVSYKGQRVYKSGDYAKWTANGKIVILGRTDNQVKLRGLRIELGEIEGLIAIQPHITKAVVVIKKVNGQDNLCAYFTADTQIDTDELRNELKKHLTHYMIPSAFVQLSEMPVTPNGKTDIKSLPEPEETKTENTPASVNYDNPITLKIKEILTDVLGENNYSNTEDLYSYGLNSLAVIRLVVEVEKAFGAQLDIKAMREGCTILQIESIVIEHILANGSVKNNSDIERLEEYGITKTQEGIYVETLSNPNTCVYNIPTLIELDESINSDKLTRAVAEAVNAHPYLRTQLYTNPDKKVCQYCDDKPFTEKDIEIIKCNTIDEVKDTLQKPFNIENDRLFRVKLIEADKSYLFIEAHHIIFDGTSKQILLSDISRAYLGEKPEKERYDGYDVFAVENKLRHSKAYDKAKKYYHNLFAGCEVDCMPLSDVNDDGAPKTSSMNIYGTSSHYSKVIEFCKSKDINPNGFFTAVYGYVLSKFADKEEAVFTTIYNGRSDIRFEKTISMMVKTYPVICHPRGKNVTEYTKEISQQLIDNMSNDVYSFAEISRDLELKAESLFVYQNVSVEKPSFCGSPLKEIAVTQDKAKANIEFHVNPEGDKIRYYCCFRSDVYSKEFIQSLVSAYDMAVEGFISGENTDDAVLTDSEMITTLDSFNNTQVEYEKTDIVTLFRRQAETNPNKVALVYNDKKYTYKQVDDISEKIAGYLKSKNIGTEDVVSVLIPRCEYMAIVSLGVLKSGAAYQPLDPSYPNERLEFMIKDASAKLVIADKSLSDRIENYRGEIFFTSEIDALPECEKLSKNPSPQDLFIMLYTSGSTGVPKGVMLEHKNLVAFCNWYKNYYKLTKDSRVAAYASYGFDANMMDMYPALTNGAELHIISEDIRLDLLAIEKYFNDNKITHSFMTTQVGRQFAVGCNPDTLKYLSVGGEKLVPAYVDKGFEFVNGYGPTECTIFTTTQPVDKKYNRVPIGLPLDNMKLYVVDKKGLRVPIGMPGELWVAGHQVSRGYLNRPEKTAEVYISNPFTKEEGYEKIYRTGDVVRYLPDGRIDFIGRNDGQVKIRGFRIELSEVEEIIRSFKGIKDATVQAFDAQSGGKFIAAYIVSDEEIDIQQLNEFILSQKPPYMVPEVTMQIEKIPLNQNHKVDKKSLPKPENKAPKQSKTAVSYDNAITLKIKECLTKILGEQDFDNKEDLTFYGLNSLGVISLVVDISQTFGVDCDVKALREGCTIASLEELVIKGFMSGARAIEEISSEKKEKSLTAPLSGSQFGVYSECMKNPYGTLYNIPMYYEFANNTDTEKLREAVKGVLLAHPYIFTTLTIENDDVVQKRADSFDIDIPVRCFDERYLEQYKSDFRKPYKLMDTRLFKIEIVKTEKSVYLFTEFHHIIFDGGSSGIFIKQLKDALEGRELEAEAYDYFDFVSNTDENSESYKSAENYFSQMLKNCESADEITPDLSGLPENGGSAMASVPVNMEKVEKFCSENKVTPAHLFLGAVFYTVSRFTNKHSAYISTISNGRSDIRLRNSFGMFVNTLPLGIDIEDITALELIKQSKAIFNGAIDNEQYPFAHIANKFNYSPDIFFAYQLGVREDIEINGEKISASAIGERSVKFKTGIYIEENNGVESIDILYNDAQYSTSLMNTLANCIRATVYNIIDNPNCPVYKLSMLDSATAKIVEDISTVKVEEPKNKILHKMFESQVELNPDFTALVAIDGKYTCKELDERANRVANALIEKGVKVGSRVVILLERTSKYFSALFGVLKAGGAFIPSCPDYPKERIQSIIEDSNADFVITYGELLNTYPRTVNIDDLEACENSSNPNADVSPDDLAYLIYTSGSTGKPKGVMLRHKGISNYLTDNEYNPQINIVKENCKCYGSVTTISFDMNFKETLNALCNGLTLVFASDEMTLNPILLGEFFQKNNVDVFNATPSRLLVYMDVPEFAKAMENCKVILSGGEKYSDKLLSVLREKTSARIINTYGPTEITVSSNAAELTNADIITVGKPLYNYIEYVVDMDNNKLPPNVVGELIIGGVGVAKGYNNLPEQTEKAFITYENQPFYRSGDYARWTDNGEIIILGRTDNQVKLRGLRIELGEIEKALTSIEGVRSGTVMIRKVGKEDGICAYFTADMVLDENEMKEKMAKTLTDYMIPASFNQLTEMPFTPNGKINVKALPEPKTKEITRTIEKPASETEKIFCDIFCDVLSVDEVSATDSFFDIGGTSLTVTRVIIQASNFGFNIAFGDVFANPSPRQLANLVAGDKEESLNPFGSISDYDYSEIDKVLAQNNMESFENGEMQRIGNVILTGATGFLGIHILNKLLENYDGKIYCLLRSSKSLNAEQRLSSMYFYYFDENIFVKYMDRVKVISGDITNAQSFDSLSELNVDTFINCAANVKHFSKGTDIEDVNYYGVKNILNFCKNKNLRLVHVSTMSVGGVYMDKKGMTDVLKEDMLYIGQTVSSKYTNSKYLAEREILQAVSQGFNGKIMRVGTLSARDTDGEYQINFETNSSTGRIKSAYIIGAYPYESMDRKIEFSPIDACADAILLLSQTPKGCTVFHPYNNHMHIMEDVYTAMNEIGLTVKAVDSKAYGELLEEVKQDAEKAKVLSSFMAYQRADGKKMYPVSKSNSFTMQVLYRMNFRWPVTSLDYMKKFLKALYNLDYFE